MPHVQTIIDGKRYPSVTEICDMLGGSKTKRLTSWAGKHGTLKAKALHDVLEKAHGKSDSFYVDEIPDSWFEANRLERSDFWKSHEELGDEAKERGQQFHADVEVALKNKRDGYAVPVSDVVSNICQWCDINHVYPREFEFHVRSREYKFGGTFDCLAVTAGGDPVLLDWKRSSSIGDSFPIQLAGYAIAYEEETGTFIDDGRIIRVYELKKPAKETKVEETADGLKYSWRGSSWFIEERRYQLHRYTRLFLSLRELYDYENKKGDWGT